MKPLNLLYIFSFFLSLGFAFTLYFNSTYIGKVVGEEKIGLIFSLASFLAATGLFILPKLILRFGNYKASKILLFVILISLLGLASFVFEKVTILFFILYFVAVIVSSGSRDIFIEKYSIEKRTGHTRGIFLTAVNLGVLLAPLGAGFLADRSFSALYLAAAILILPCFFIISKFRGFHDPHYRPPQVAEIKRKIKEDKNVLWIYLANFALQFFYAWMIIYTPIYLNKEIGFSFETIGLIFTIMLLPFVILQIPFGRLADRVGEKEMLIAGFVLIGLASSSIFFINLPNVLLWAGLLFITRVGAATVEVMSESYFFKRIKAQESESIGFFRNTYPIANILAPLLASLILVFLPFKSLFPILGGLMILSLYPVLKLKDTA